MRGVTPDVLTSNIIGTPYASGFDEETSNQCSGTCPECDGEIDIEGGERTCRECGLVIDGYGIAREDRSVWQLLQYSADTGRNSENQPNTQELCKPTFAYGYYRD